MTHGSRLDDETVRFDRIFICPVVQHENKLQSLSKYGAGGKLEEKQSEMTIKVLCLSKMTLNHS